MNEYDAFNIVAPLGVEVKMETYQVENLPEIDQRAIKAGKCPWCLGPLVDGALIEKGAGDICTECGDEFVGSLTIKD